MSLDRAAPPGPVARDPEASAQAVCLRLLTRRAHTRAELAAALARRGVVRDVADRVLQRFTEVGLIDDAAVAEAFVATRHRDRGLARQALGLELRRRGIENDDARAALDTVTREDEEARARALVARRLPSTRGQPTAARARRLLALLARKGYSSGLASAVVREALATEADPAEIDAALPTGPD